ncbi:hypothetical protein TWF788_007915, partial [Orbilia oligospora]
MASANGTASNPGSDGVTSSPPEVEVEDYPEPTSEEKAALRHVAENLPLSAWLVAIVELCERFSYYGCQGLFQNFIQRPYNGREGPGALGLGQHGATGLGTFFQFWCY